MQHRDVYKGKHNSDFFHPSREYILRIVSVPTFENHSQAFELREWSIP